MPRLVSTVLTIASSCGLGGCVGGLAVTLRVGVTVRIAVGCTTGCEVVTEEVEGEALSFVAGACRFSRLNIKSLCSFKKLRKSDLELVAFFAGSLRSSEEMK
eukprot:TRINITY_DN7441_c0_g1_i1.p1 TRINITY_DN7441_c0_g1~~TRINITY_DN7441_c0_g1_i1.p1  ORF type:complete len:102 (-),score=11.70 TRINITY_DN7441_c0_g1_i1:253-558(-)